MPPMRAIQYVLRSKRDHREKSACARAIRQIAERVDGACRERGTMRRRRDARGAKIRRDNNERACARQRERVCGTARNTGA